MVGPPACPECDAPAPGLAAPGPIVVLADDRYEPLFRLLTGGLDTSACPICGTDQGAPTVAVRTAEGVVHYVPGPLLPEPETGRWVPAAGTPHLVRYPSAGALREGVLQLLSDRLPAVAGLLTAVAEQRWVDHLLDRWRLLTPDVITALSLAVTVGDDRLRVPRPCPAADAFEPPPGLAALFDPRAPVESAATAVAALQVQIWLMLGAEWAARVPSDPGATLAGDLGTYVSGETVAPDALPVLLGVLDEDMTARLDPYVRYALGASAARALRIPDPRAARWAELYFAVEMACRLDLGEARASMTGLRVPDVFARATVPYREAWQAAGRTLATLYADRPGPLGGRTLPEAVSVVHEIAVAAGWPQLVPALLETVLGSALDEAAGPDEILAAALPAGAATPVGAAVAAVGLHLDARTPDARAELTDVLAQRLLALYGTDGEAEVVVWWANRLDRDGRVDDAAEVLRDWPLPDAEPVPPEVRARRLGAEARVCAGRGRPDEAIARWRAAAGLPVGETQRDWARTNLALQLAQAGAPDEALTILEAVTGGRGRLGLDPELLAHQAALHVRFGNHDRALADLDEAHRLAGASSGAYRYLLSRCQLLVAGDRYDEAVAGLLDVASRGRPPDVTALLAESAAWVLLLRRAAGLPPPAVARAESMPAILRANAGRAAEIGNVADHLRLTFALADVLEAAGDTGEADPHRLWALREAADRSIPVEPLELVRGAAAAWRTGDPETMRRLLAEAPDAMIRRYGAVADISLLVHEPRAQLRVLAGLAEALLTGDAPAGDLRLIAELQRDALGRARAAHRDARGAGAEPPRRWYGEVAERIPADAAPVVVVEWLRVGDDRIRCLATRVADGQSRPVWLALPPVPPDEARAEIAGRLYNWLPGGADSPFGAPGWQELATGMVALLGELAGEDDHIVFLHSDVYSNLPWQAAIRGRWSMSYAAGWAHLFAVLGRPPAPRNRVGVCLVPAAQDAGPVVERLRSSRDRVAGWAGSGLHAVGVPERSDRGYLTTMLAATDVAVLLCHGRKTDAGSEVGLMLAHGGLLPPSDSVAAGLVPGHFFGWRDALRLDRASRTVLSAACSSGHGFGAGLGDRLGLATALRQAGTTAMVAPAWEIDAAEILPLLDDITERYLRGEPLGRALRDATRDADGTGPDWVVWSLALDGDYR
ncbi:CHAT domain-containing protein [Actinoplanes sp. GCM10030250]|uniref:CHAT domain-containing protein n=1 Tax=Actinoplanes sp. GCM10030250 TaxID=3273376 RepID=UPI0036085246